MRKLDVSLRLIAHEGELMSSKEKAKLLSMFAKTRALIKTENTENRENAMCIIVLDGAEYYCNAILILLNKNYVFPAKALMRCLCELTVKLMWCLQCPDDTDEEQDRKTVNEKIRRWEKSTCAQNIKVLEELKSVQPQNNEIDAQLKKLREEKGNLGVKEMPKYAQLLKYLPHDFWSKVSPALYKNFNNAVHLDTNSLGEIYLYNNKANVNNSDIIRLKDCCLLLAKIIARVIALNYNR